MHLKDLRIRLREIRARPDDHRARGSRGDGRETELALVVEERIDAVWEGIHRPPGSGDAEEPLLFLDLETTGLSAAARIGMAGYLYWTESELRLVQEVARDVAEERLLLESAAERIALRPRVVTYNGRSFDLPVLRRRLAYHSLPPLTARVQVVDLLIPARRRYRGSLPDCRLATVERSVLGRRRPSRDVPGAEVPLRFLDFGRTGDRKYLDPVLCHNRIDLTTLAILNRTLQPFRPHAGQKR